MNDTLVLDFNEFTLGDVEDFEDASGLSFEEMLRGQVKLRGKVLTALVWIAMRRNTPSMTLADARKLPVTILNNVRMGAEAAVEAAQAESNDPNAPAEAAPRRRSRKQDTPQEA